MAFGESRYLWRPQIVLQAQYSRFAKFNNLQDYYFRFQQNNAAIGVQITIPFFDVAHKAKAREADADAAHAEHEADSIRDQFFDSRLRIQHAVAEARRPLRDRHPRSAGSPSRTSTSSSFNSTPATETWRAPR
ncbi:TolC family protein [Tunturiibacter empetritectus]|uniref:TolC family protein n=1 Tax=Tunturiibacter empetritectus TaxID=3069691 RepID=UPI003D9AB72E